MKISLKSRCGKRVEGKKKFSSTSDSLTLLEESTLIWKSVIKFNKLNTIKQVSVVLYDLESASSPQIDFLESFSHAVHNSMKKRNLISQTMDKINTRFGRDSVTIGSIPKEISPFSGTKVAFTRIPDINEFHE